MTEVVRSFLPSTSMAWLPDSSAFAAYGLLGCFVTHRICLAILERLRDRRPTTHEDAEARPLLSQGPQQTRLSRFSKILWVMGSLSYLGIAIGGKILP